MDRAIPNAPINEPPITQIFKEKRLVNGSKKKIEIEASIRADLGKGASRRLRREEKVPGVVYGGGKDAVSLTLEQRNLFKALENDSFYSQILTLKTGSDSERVIVKDMQRHPFKPRVLHIDFQRVRADVKLSMNVPLHFLNSDKAPGVKDASGILSHIETDVEISCLPDDLPDHLEIDLGNMQLNDTFHLSDLKLPKGVELVALQHGDDKPIVSIHMPRAEEEIPTEAPVASEVPAIAQKAEDESKPASK